MSKMKENDMMMVIGEESEQITNCKFCLGEREWTKKLMPDFVYVQQLFVWDIFVQKLGEPITS